MPVTAQTQVCEEGGRLGESIVPSLNTHRLTDIAK